MKMNFVLMSAAMATAAGACAVLGGCNLVAPAVYLIHGPDKIKPQYELPEDRPAIVFIDDRANALPSRSARQRVSKACEKTLLEGKAVSKSEILDSNQLLPLTMQERFGKPMGIAQIGEMVKADVVVYATVDAFTISTDGQTFSPMAKARVKVIDVKTKKRLFPTEQEEWAPVETNMDTKPKALPKNIGERTTAENELADILGRNIGRVFIEFVPEEVAKRVGE